MTASVPKHWAHLVRDHAALSSTARLAGFVLATYMDNKTGACFPGIELIAKGMHCSEKTAKRATKELLDAELLVRRRRFNASSVYVPVLVQVTHEPYTQATHDPNDVQVTRDPNEERTGTSAPFVGITHDPLTAQGTTQIQKEYQAYRSPMTRTLGGVGSSMTTDAAAPTPPARTTAGGRQGTGRESRDIVTHLTHYPNPMCGI